MCVCACVCHAHMCSMHSMVTISCSRSSDGRHTHIIFRVLEPLERMCGVGCVWLCPCPCLRVVFCFLSRACMVRHLNCPLQYLPLALGHVFGSQEHTQSVGCVSFAFCVRINGILNLQHAQHGAQNGLHFYNERVAYILPHVSDPQECVCGACFDWFYY